MTTPFPPQNNEGLIRQYLAHQQTIPYQAMAPTLSESAITSSPFSLSDTYQSQAIPEIAEQAVFPTQPTKKPPILRVVAVVLVGILILSIYLIWHTSSSSTTSVSTTQQHFNLAPTTSTLNLAPTTSTFKTGATVSSVVAAGKIQVYIVGAVKKPGIYTLETNARIYELLQVAGGPLLDANLVALNLAARLTDGQEIYVSRVGETPPVSTSSISSTNTTSTTTTASQININTASADDLRKGLHISSTNAQAIINYRLQHGPFTSVEELLQVVSQATYKKIKDQVKFA